MASWSSPAVGAARETRPCERNASTSGAARLRAARPKGKRRAGRGRPAAAEEEAPPEARRPARRRARSLHFEARRLFDAPASSTVTLAGRDPHLSRELVEALAAPFLQPENFWTPPSLLEANIRSASASVAGSNPPLPRRGARHDGPLAVGHRVEVAPEDREGVEVARPGLREAPSAPSTSRRSEGSRGRPCGRISSCIRPRPGRARRRAGAARRGARSRGALETRGAQHLAELAIPVAERPAQGDGDSRSICCVKGSSRSGLLRASRIRSAPRERS